MIETHRYDEFGVMETPTQTDRAVDFAYTGYPYEDNGLYYAQARYYNPEAGRFISEDTYEGNILNPLSQNLYTYTQNNPMGYVDPSGHNPLTILSYSSSRTSDLFSGCGISDRSRGICDRCVWGIGIG
nr:MULTISPECIES: RHS repeat-associated core domain-containing protein [Paenibacillus]